MKHSEDSLHTKIWDALQRVLPQNAYAMSHENRGNNPIEGHRRKMRGCLAGWPDLQVIYGGQHHLIEIKTAKGRVSKVQNYTHERLKRAGADVAVCRSVDEVLEHLKARGVPLRGRISA